MSRLRPQLSSNPDKWPLISNGTAYLMILTAVQRRDGLLHGKLRERGEVCAIGSYFDINGHTALPIDLIDEVAAVNDSVPHLSKRQRKRHVVRWLRWRLERLGFPLPGRKSRTP